MSLIEIKTATITEKGQIAIPKGIRKNGFRTGSKVAILAFNDRIELRPIEQISEKMFAAIASEKVLAKDWNRKKDEKAWRNL